MQKQIDILLYKNLLLIDFCVVQPTTLLKLVSTKKWMQPQNALVFLDLFESIKMFKFLARGMLFSQKLLKSRLVLKVATMQQFLLLKDFASEYSLSNFLTVEQDNNISNKFQLDFSNFYYFFGQNTNTKYTTDFYRKLLLQKIFFVLHINFNLNFNTCGSYKFYCDTSDFKKLIFIVMFMNKLI